MEIKDDTDRVQAMLDRGERIPPGVYRTTRPLVMPESVVLRQIPVGAAGRAPDNEIADLTPDDPGGEDGLAAGTQDVEVAPADDRR